MKALRRRAEELLWATGLHSLAIPVYGMTRRGRDRAALLSRLVSFYGALLPRDVLVFDIGANAGCYSSVFCSLKTRVVAVEPNPDCARHIALFYGREDVEVLQAAAGRQNGLATITLSDELDLISSMSQDWIDSVEKAHPDYAGKWSRKLTVPVVTLDSLIQHYGVPYFVKIDVEGSEEDVLAGLSVQPPLLSFEFNMAFLDATFRCLDRDVFSEASLFNFTFGEPSVFALRHWVQPGELKRIFQTTRQTHSETERYGDVFVRRPG